MGSVKTVQKKNIPYWIARDHRDLVRWLKARGEGPVFVLENDEQTHRLISRSGLTVTVSCRDIPRLPDEHIIDYFARACGFSEENKFYERYPELHTNNQEKEDCKVWLERMRLRDHPLVLIQSGNRKSGRWARKSEKDWPCERWVEFMRNVLNSKSDSRILLCGSAQEKRITLGMQQAIADPRVLSVAGDLNLRRLFALLQISHSMISVDTGPAHAAAALGCPLVVLFGGTDPRDISPVSRTSPVLIVTGPPGAPEPSGKIEWSKHHFMEGISVESVTDAWRKING